ncbi:hypothetical protein ABXT08_11280 [Chryseobacterium sp. NRRL B-14859]|uniref:hypothetical protein n=1 Tax=unclassified Chryseobacterium TaxID=2593645 RepID=UPI0011CEA37D|nr:hypothetical protein [Chryseobacterium sp. G0240]
MNTRNSRDRSSGRHSSESLEKVYQLGYDHSSDDREVSGSVYNDSVRGPGLGSGNYGRGVIVTNRAGRMRITGMGGQAFHRSERYYSPSYPGREGFRLIYNNSDSGSDPGGRRNS